MRLKQRPREPGSPYCYLQWPCRMETPDVRHYCKKVPRHRGDHVCVCDARKRRRKK